MTKMQDQLAQRLNWLMCKMKVTSDEVAAGTGLSASHIRKLKVGLSCNPTLEHLETLANYFNVQVSFFTDAIIEEDLDVFYLIKSNNRKKILLDDSGVNLATMRLAQILESNPTIKEIALRIAELDTAERNFLLSMLSEFEKLRRSGKESG